MSLNFSIDFYDSIIKSIEKSYWKELDDDIIYYHYHFDPYYFYSDLNIKNTKFDRSEKYQEIRPKSFGQLNKQNSYINVFIETSKHTIIGKLDKIKLSLKIRYKIFQESLFYQHPLYHFNHNIFLIIQNRKLIQLRGNKLIRKHQGNIYKMLPKSIITKIGFNYDHKIKQKDYLYYYFKKLFENFLNISIMEIKKNQGKQIFQKVGDFLILKTQSKYRIKTDEHQVYYLSKQEILNGNGIKGKFYLKQNETLKVIKSLDNILYIIIKKKIIDLYFSIYQIKNEQEREQIFQIITNSDIKKPILMQNHLIFTKKKNSKVTEKHKIELKVNQNQIK